MALARVATASSLAHVSGNKKVGEEKEEEAFQICRAVFFQRFFGVAEILCAVQLKNLINLDYFHCVYSDVVCQIIIVIRKLIISLVYSVEASHVMT